MTSICSDRYDVIIVEDEPVSRRALTSLVSHHGFNTASFSTAEEALSAIALSGMPPVVLVDYNLPGMNGVEFIRHLEQSGGNPFSVLITAASADVACQARRCRPMPHLRKPLDFPRLMRLLAERHLRN